MGTFVGTANTENATIEASRQVLRDVAEGAVSRNALTALALAVLASAATAPAERVRLALEVREGGPHAVRRAIELAALVLTASGTRESDAEVSEVSEVE